MTQDEGKTSQFQEDHKGGGALPLNPGECGKFYVDDAGDKLYIGSDPSGKTVEAAARIFAIHITNNGPGSVIRGLGFAHYAPHQRSDETAMVRLNTAGVTVENNTFAWSACAGLHVLGANPVIRGNTFVYNGLVGYGAYRGDNGIVEGNIARFNNYERFRVSWAAAGAKFARTKYLTVRDNIFSENWSKGFWCDVSCYDTTIVRNLIQNNLSDGIKYEISHKAVIASNVVTGSGDSGIDIGGASSVAIYNNTLVENEEHITIRDGISRNTKQEEIALGITWDTRDTIAKNNLYSNNDGSATSFISVRDENSPGVASNQLLTASNFNAYYRTSSGVPSTLIRWWNGSSYANYTTVAAFRTATGYEQNALAIDNQAVNPFFIDENAGNYHLKSGSMAQGSGEGVVNLLPVDRINEHEGA